jgi:integrase
LSDGLQYELAADSCDFRYLHRATVSATSTAERRQVKGGCPKRGRKSAVTRPRPKRIAKWSISVGTEVTLPILPVLDATLKAGPCGDLTYIAGQNGRPLTKESFGNLFRKACRDAGLHDRSAHGLRKAAARAANAGATVAELEAIFGWQGGTMAALYTRAADRRRLAQGAMHKARANER